MIENNNLISFEEFLIAIPPGKKKTTSVLTIENSYTHYYSIQVKNIELYCEDNSCEGIRFFINTNTPSVIIKQPKPIFLTFICKNCEKSSKIYSIVFILNAHNLCDVYKIGEFPNFGPPVPTRMFSLLGEDKEIFLAGRRAENQGMGIGAYAYYRRVVENQKNRIFDEIIKVVKGTKVSDELVEDLLKAKKETQFTNAIDSIKAALPEDLLISGHNPLTLLHKALSEGIHANSDEECLEYATSIRIVLAELSDRITYILKGKKELDTAVGKLLIKKSKKEL